MIENAGQGLHTHERHENSLNMSPAADAMHTSFAIAKFAEVIMLSDSNAEAY